MTASQSTTTESLEQPTALIQTANEPERVTVPSVSPRETTALKENTPIPPMFASDRFLSDVDFARQTIAELEQRWKQSANTISIRIPPTDPWRSGLDQLDPQIQQLEKRR